MSPQHRKVSSVFVAIIILLAMLCICLNYRSSVHAVPTYTEQIVNGSFEYQWDYNYQGQGEWIDPYGNELGLCWGWTGPWHGSGLSTAAHSGNYSFNLKSGTTSVGCMCSDQIGQSFGKSIPKSAIYSFTCWVKGSGYEWSCGMGGSKDFTAYIRQTPTTTPTASGEFYSFNYASWTQINLLSYIPDGALVNSITFYVYGLGSSGSSLLIDDVSLLAYPTATLAITAPPISIAGGLFTVRPSVSVNGTQHNTPCTCNEILGTTYNLSVAQPSIYPDGGHVWTFNHWLVNNTLSFSTPKLNLTLTGDTTIQMNYTYGTAAGIIGILTVTSTLGYPFGVSVFINGTLQSLDDAEYIRAGTYQFALAQRVFYSVGGYYQRAFLNWVVNGVNSGDGTSLITHFTTGDNTVILNYSTTWSAVNFADKWLLGGNLSPKINLAKLDVNASSSILLTGDLTGTLLCGLVSAFGYYLIGTTSSINTGGVYTPHYIDAGAVWEYNGSTYTDVISYTTDLRITGIAKGIRNSLISALYTSYTGDYGHGRLYSYNGTELTDLTSVLGGSLNTLDITSMLNLGNIWLFGIYDSYSSQTYLSSYNEVTGSLTRISTLSAPATTMARTLQYALIGSNNSPYLLKYYPDTNSLVDISSNANFPTDDTVNDIVWNGTDFMFALSGGHPKVVAYDGANWLSIETGYSYTVLGWDGDYWLFGGSDTGHCLVMLNGSSLTVLTSPFSNNPIDGIATPLNTFAVYVNSNVTSTVVSSTIKQTHTVPYTAMMTSPNFEDWNVSNATVNSAYSVVLNNTMTYSSANEALFIGAYDNGTPVWEVEYDNTTGIEYGNSTDFVGTLQTNGTILVIVNGNSLTFVTNFGTATCKTFVLYPTFIETENNDGVFTGGNLTIVLSSSSTSYAVSKAASVPFTLNGKSYVTPTILTLTIGGSQPFVTPQSVASGGQTYNFLHTLIIMGDPTSSVVTQLSSNISLFEDTFITIYYNAILTSIPPWFPSGTYSVSVQSSPIEPVPFTLDTSSFNTPWSQGWTWNIPNTFGASQPTITINSTDYIFEKWELQNSSGTYFFTGTYFTTGPIRDNTVITLVYSASPITCQINLWLFFIVLVIIIAVWIIGEYYKKQWILLIPAIPALIWAIYVVLNNIPCHTHWIWMIPIAIIVIAYSLYRYYRYRTG